MPLDIFSLAGRVALVTGASRGLGAAVATLFARAGATVILNARNQAGLDRITLRLREEGLTAETAAFDAADAGAVERAIGGIVKRFGRIDVAVANAGTTLRKPLLEMTRADWDGQMSLLLDAAFHLGRSAGRAMVERGKGSLVFMSSALEAAARPNVAAYVAAKAGLAGLTRAIAVELGPLGVRCNAVAPGYIRTELTRPLVDDPRFNGWVVDRTPMRRWGDPEEIAAVALFLASDAASYVNGVTLFVDGGMVVHA